ncbi:unnamed protein product [Dibothriocephalus latus]|uniref:Cytosolic endo-beta-N-acetylglucosaminidase TIM barrel domain-containing protein n=1 Tax=Dibothriocephalus latus TaxID=60516 RepID=A0A3P6PXP3_DIBLA|nr:unnamed protein product [Dibothriocephalus latus]
MFHEVLRDFIDVPINSLEQLKSWTPPLHADETIYQSTFYRGLDLPKVMFCHDMAGGYLEFDRTIKPTAEFPSFRYVHWHLIDVFVYFSHQNITIPPIGWINVAHRYRLVFIIGATLSVIINIGNHAAMTIATAGLFEGWLINMEIEFPKVYLIVFSTISHISYILSPIVLSYTLAVN